MASTAASSASSDDLKDYHRNLRRKLKRLKIPGNALKELGVELGHGVAKVRLLEVFGMRCAGKKLHDLLFKDATRETSTVLVDRFTEECIRLSELRHPNIVQLIGVTFDEKSLTLVMEYLPTTLTDFLEGYENIPDFTKASVLLDIGYGMLFLHQQDPPIVHRDLSTNNVLLTRDLQAKISDLGVAKRVQEDGESGLMQLMSLCPGAQLFMPPESKTSSPRDASKAEYDTKLDCFSFGNIIIQVIVQKWLEFLLEADPEDPSRPLKNEVKRRYLYLQEMADHMLYDLAVKCLRDNPVDRPTSVEVVRKLKAFKDDNPLPFQNPVEMWNAYTSSSDRLRRLQSDVAELKSIKSQDDDGASCSFEKLKIRVQALEKELIGKKKDMLKKESEIAGYKSSIVSLKKMLSSVSAQGQEQENGYIPGSPERHQHVQPSPVPPSREKKLPPPKPPRPWAFSMSSSPPLSPPPLSPYDSFPKSHPSTSTDSASSDTSPIQRRPQAMTDDMCYSDLPSFPDPYYEVQARAPPTQARSQLGASTDDTIEISSSPNFQPQPRPRAFTQGASVQPKPRPRNISAPIKPESLQAGSPSGAPIPPQKPGKKGKPTTTPVETHDEPMLSKDKAQRKTSAPDQALPGKYRQKPLPPIPKNKAPTHQPPQFVTDETNHYEVPIPVPHIISSGRKKQQQPKLSDTYEEIKQGSSIYEIPLVPKPAAESTKPPSQDKPARPPPPPKPYSGKRPHPGIPKVAMLPNTGSEDTQFQKLLARQQQKVEEGEAGDRFQELEKQRSQPQLSEEKDVEVDPTLKRKLEKQKKKIRSRKRS